MNALPFVKERRLEIAVTGLRRAGKTAFITSAIQNLRAFAENPEALPLLNQPGFPKISSAVPFGAYGGRTAIFPFREHLRKMIVGEWPTPTAAVSRAEVALRYRRRILGQASEADLHVGFIDYPGEWLIDIAMEPDYDAWSARTLADMRKPSRAEFSGEFLEMVSAIDPAAPADQGLVSSLHASYVGYLSRCRDAGFAYLQPGRYLMSPDDLNAVVTPVFVPIETSHGVKCGRNSYVIIMREAYAKYLEHCVNAFYGETFAKNGNQIVLVDLLGALNAGEQAYNDTAHALRSVYSAIDARRRRRSWQNWLMLPLYGQVVFAVTKSDHVPESKRANLICLLEKILCNEEDSATQSGSKVTVVALSSVRCTSDEIVVRDVGEVDVVAGIQVGTDIRKQVSFGTVPSLPPTDIYWKRRRTDFPTFKPPPVYDNPDDGIAHIGMDDALRHLLLEELR